MSLIDLASLVLAPTATKEGKVYSAIPDTGEGDMTFTRGSAATRVNSAGLIEKERENVIVYSQDFSNANWQTNASATISHGITDPNGGSTASRLTFAASVNSGIYQQNLTLFGSNNIRTASLYMKGSVGGEVVMFGDATNRTSVTLTTSWVRYEGFEIDASTYFIIYTNTFSPSADTIDIAFVQYENGLVAQPYIETTTTAVYEGITDDVPRVDYSGGGCPSLLLEPQRTNELPHSEYFGASNWLLDGGTQSITTNYAISPEGVQNATRLQLNKTGVTYSRIYGDAGSLGQATISVYMKSNTSETQNVGLRYDGTGINCEVTTEWQRFDLTATSTSVSRFQILLFDSIVGNDETADILIYGAMLESSVTYATSYLPTYGTSTTRVQDSCYKTGISELIGQNEGTLFVEFVSKADDATNHIVSLSDGTTSNRVSLVKNTSDDLRAFVSSGGSTQASILWPNYEPNTIIKAAISYKANEIVFYANGEDAGTDTNASVPVSLTQIEFETSGNPFAYPVKQLLIFPTALTDTQLEELTK
jgi:hypothetical protein